MEKTLILGNKPEKWWIKDLGETDVLSVPNFSAGKNSDISNFVRELPKDIDRVVIDADSLYTENIELPLDLALQIRLMLRECLHTSLSSIIIVSDLSIEAFSDYGVKSMILMTRKVSLVQSEVVCEVIRNSSSLSPGEYVEGFLNLIKIEPQQKIEGRHSIANEWGAERLGSVVCPDRKSDIIPLKTSSSLYFRYCDLVSLNADEVRGIINCKSQERIESKEIESEGVKFLLIDDEADKGWLKVLSALMPDAEYDVWDTPIHSYEEISPEIRNNIKSRKYDLIFLDLRMAGVSEESVLKPEAFSGMRILRAIKKVNCGIQVIMLTATNKAWNLKALLEAGANGYYMKESPEYHFPVTYSEQNANALIDTIETCLDNSYLRHIVARMAQLRLPDDSECSDNIYNQLKIALSLILKAKTNADYAFAYISLEQVFEIATSSLIRQSWNSGRCEFFFTEDTHEKCRLIEGGKDKGLLDSAAQWKKVSAIYYQLYGGDDCKFSTKAEALISLRNEYIHPGKEDKPVITQDDFQNLFDVIVQFLSVFK